jgi:hypothetical protein
MAVVDDILNCIEQYNGYSIIDYALSENQRKKFGLLFILND